MYSDKEIPTESEGQSDLYAGGIVNKVMVCYVNFTMHSVGWCAGV